MKESNKPTPGPWECQPLQADHGASLAIVSTHNGWVVAVIPPDPDIQLSDEVDMGNVVRHPYDKPNGALLAAAPLLYEALAQIVGQEKPNRWGYDAASVAMDDAWREKARAALAAAKPRQTPA